MKLKILFNTFIVFGFFLNSSLSFAWVQITCNNGTKKHWNVKQYMPVLDPVTIAINSEQYSAAVTAINQMDKNPSNFRYISGGSDNSDSVGLFNNESEIWFADLTLINAMNAKTIETVKVLPPDAI